MKRLVLLLAISIPLFATTKSAPKPLPVLGTQFHSLPDGEGKTQA